MKGIFYSVGVGPGDPALMTYKAAQTITLCDIIAVPESGGSENIALTIAKEHIGGKKIIYCDMPMIRDANAQREYHDRTRKLIGEFLDSGKSVAFLTLGDPSIYSTAMYIHSMLTEDGYETHIIPGVPSFCAAAAGLNITLCEGGQPLHIIPASYGGDYLELDGVKVLMKSGKSIGGVIDTLKKQENIKAYMVERASMKDEKLFYSVDEMENTGYFSVVVVKPL